MIVVFNPWFLVILFKLALEKEVSLGNHLKNYFIVRDFLPIMHFMNSGFQSAIIHIRSIIKWRPHLQPMFRNFIILRLKRGFKIVPGLKILLGYKFQNNLLLLPNPEGSPLSVVFWETFFSWLTGLSSRFLWRWGFSCRWFDMSRLTAISVHRLCWKRGKGL